MTTAADAPIHDLATPSQKAQNRAYVLEDVSRWWENYPVKKYLPTAKAYTLLKSYTQEAFEVPKGAARSCLASRHQTTRTADLSTIPIKKCSDYSLLAPSHMLDVSERTAPRQIRSHSEYHPKSAEWFSAMRSHQSVDRRWNAKNLARNTLKSTLSDSLHDSAMQEISAAYEPSKRYSITVPTDVPLWELPFMYEEGKRSGMDLYMQPSLYTNYERQDDRDYMKYMICKPIRAPYVYSARRGIRTTASPAIYPHAVATYVY